MIESWIKNPLSLKRYRRFKNQKRAVISTFILLFLMFLSITAEFWSNSKPIVLGYNGGIYFPIIKTYHPTKFGQTETLYTDYRKLEEQSWSIWPIVSWDPYESDLSYDTYPAAPDSKHWFGTDDRGRDVLARLLYGFRYSFSYAFWVWFASYFIGIFLGAIMGYVGGYTDLIGQRIVEIFQSLPFLLILITVFTVFKVTLFSLVLLTAALSWTMISIYVRAEFLKLRKREFVEAARAQGQSRLKIMFKHILPNAMAPVITFSPFAIAGYISSLSILDYLGFGFQPPTPSWGELLSQAQANFTSAWWLAVYTSLVLFITLLCLNLIGEGVRDAFDPRKIVKQKPAKETKA